MFKFYCNALDIYAIGGSIEGCPNPYKDISGMTCKYPEYNKGCVAYCSGNCPAEWGCPLIDNTRVRIKLGSKEYVYFYFKTISLDPNDLNAYTHPLTKTDFLEVRLEPWANDYLGGDMLVRYAGQTCDGKLPTLKELNYTWSTKNNQPIWHANWDPPRWDPPRWRDDLYWLLSSSAFEAPQIGGDPHYPLGCYYILVYNDDRYNQGMTDLYISFVEYASKYHGPGY